ncbi:MAG: type II toxin-antitoxin system RelE/ParE family toxin [Bacteroidaceae bacterium]|nr:type II toxin-antitoxin system RelE/ParE family toxin [Bacteroidaceae bacterium]
MSLKTRWSRPALLSLADVLDYTLEEHGVRQYKKMRKQVMDAVRQLSVSPFMAAVEPYSDKVGVELRGYVVIPHIKIIYSVVDDILYIEYIKNTYLSEQTMLERMGYFPEEP